MNEMVWIRPLWKLDAGCIEVRVKRFWWSRVTQRRRGVVMSHNDRRYLRYAITYGLLALGLAAYMWLFMGVARAQDGDARWYLRPLAQQCLDDASCRSTLRRPRRYRPHYVAPSRNYTYHLPEQAPRVYGYERRDHRDGRSCERMVSRTGEERYGQDRAKESADQQWMEEVRNRYGVRYMDMRNSRRVTYECSRSSTGNRASEKASDVVGRFLEQCVVEAIPCRADPQRADKDERR